MLVRCCGRFQLDFDDICGELMNCQWAVVGVHCSQLARRRRRALIKHLRRLFFSLNLKETDEHAFILKSKQQPTLKVVGPIIRDHVQPRMQQLLMLSEKNMNAELPDARHGQDVEINNPSEDNICPRKRVIGSEMPSAELLAAAAKLTEAEAE
ncbi:OLC1v1031864C1 [Oldenlandia corymbosa var. corymbosa]|uniref:OLC1v1031864C1 n=1 Tax=Oldenlandia corymbosa var. corymbosa TaxID=529605 RepID=A0AAV1CKA9_OLDCO|nr:OLC1v1031864C1 [Oldenlandia corymbosa var. corymbosa]